MNIDLASQFDFGDADGLRHFMLDHRFVHDQTAAAIKAKYGTTASTFGLTSSAAEQVWEELMRAGQEGREPDIDQQALMDWLQFHMQIHTFTYSQIGGPSFQAPDLSIVDFSNDQQFYDWLLSHQAMHDFEQSSLGLV